MTDAIIRPDLYRLELPHPEVLLVAAHLQQGRYADVSALLFKIKDQMDKQDFEEAQRRIQLESEAVGKSLAAQFAEQTGLPLDRLTLSEPGPALLPPPADTAAAA